MTKSKPVRTPRALDARVDQSSSVAKEAIRSSKRAIARSTELVRKSKEIMAVIAHGRKP